MTTLPTGETLPEYDDQHPEGADIDKLVAWVRGNRVSNGVWGYKCDPTTVRDVLAALQAVGDATIVKNSTYRVMRRDGADIERLAARLANTGRSGLIIECGGPVGAALAILTELDADTVAPPPAVTG